MAVQVFQSDSLLVDATGGKPGAASNRANAVLRAMRWNVPDTTIVGDAGSTLQVCTLPYASRYLASLSKMGWEPFGTGRTLNFGWLPYRMADGTEVAGNPAGLATGLDVALAGRSFFDAFPLSSLDEWAPPAPVTLILTVLGGTIPVGTGVGGIIVYLSAS
jgi:hypothetical protein